jgi:hypothetical protein
MRRGDPCPKTTFADRLWVICPQVFFRLIVWTTTPFAVVTQKKTSARPDRVTRHSETELAQLSDNVRSRVANA